MALSPRERTIALVVGAAAGLFLLDAVAITPYWTTREALAKSIRDADTKLNDAHVLGKRRKELGDVWRKMNAGGLKSDVVEAESQLFHALREWTQESGLNFSSSKPERATSEGKFTQINTQVSGSGPQASVAKLLWRLETATIPIRVTEMNVNARREGNDELQVQLGVSTLCDKPESDKPDAAGNRRTVASAASGKDRS